MLFRSVKRQRNKRIAFIAIAADVCVTRHDPVCSLCNDVLATTLDRGAPREGLFRIANVICDRSMGSALRQASANFATRLFNRAYEHGSLEWEHVLDGGPHVIDVAKPVAATGAGPIFIRRHVHLCEAV